MLARAVAALDEPLPRGHAADVVVKHKLGRQDGQRARVHGRRRLVHHNVQQATVILVARHLHVLAVKNVKVLVFIFMQSCSLKFLYSKNWFVGIGKGLEK